jgi:hypothetical protein
MVFDETDPWLSYSEKIKHAEEGLGIVFILEHVASSAERDKSGKSKERGCKHFRMSDCNEQILQEQRNVYLENLDARREGYRARKKEKELSAEDHRPSILQSKVCRHSGGPLEERCDRLEQELPSNVLTYPRPTGGRRLHGMRRSGG